MTSATPRHLAIRHYLACLMQPLVPPTEPPAAFDGVARLFEQSPDWMAYWWARSMYTVAMTLPEEDPWRTLSVPGVHRRPITSDGLPFGTWGDGTDLGLPHKVHSEHVSVDPVFAPVAAPLSTSAGNLIARAMHGEAPLKTDILSLWNRAGIHTRPAITGRPSLRAVFVTDACDSALRWLLWRRQQYVGPGDAWAFWEMVKIAHEADREVDGRVSTEAVFHIDGRLDPGAYRDLIEANRASGL